ASEKDNQETVQYHHHSGDTLHSPATPKTPPKGFSLISLSLSTHSLSLQFSLINGAAASCSVLRRQPTRTGKHRFSDLEIADPRSIDRVFVCVARASVFAFGLAYGNIKLKFHKMKAKPHSIAEAKRHH
ncbi:hypothetical protein AKJ16_DCAP08684, partial [Drosera capensis]